MIVHILCCFHVTLFPLMKIHSCFLFCLLSASVSTIYQTQVFLCSSISNCKLKLMYHVECTMGLLHEGRVERQIQHEAETSAVFASRPAPRAKNPIVHETCGTLTGLLCDFRLRLYKKTNSGPCVTMDMHCHLVKQWKNDWAIDRVLLWLSRQCSSTVNTRHGRVASFPGPCCQKQKFSTTRHVCELNQPRNQRSTRVSSCAIISKAPSLLARLTVCCIQWLWGSMLRADGVHVPWVTSAVPSWGPYCTLPLQAVPFTKLLNKLYSVPVTPSTLGLERSVSETRHALKDGGYRCLSSN